MLDTAIYCEQYPIVSQNAVQEQGICAHWKNHVVHGFCNCFNIGLFVCTVLFLPLVHIAIICISLLPSY